MAPRCTPAAPRPVPDPAACLRACTRLFEELALMIAAPGGSTDAYQALAQLAADCAALAHTAVRDGDAGMATDAHALAAAAALAFDSMAPAEFFGPAAKRSQPIPL